MNIYLGNLTTEEIESRIGIDFPQEIRNFMKQTHQDRAENIEEGRWHCFDIPFVLVCGDRATAQKIFDSVSARAGECKEPLQFAINTKPGVAK